LGSQTLRARESLVPNDHGWLKMIDYSITGEWNQVEKREADCFWGRGFRAVSTGRKKGRKKWQEPMIFFATARNAIGSGIGGLGIFRAFLVLAVGIVQLRSLQLSTPVWSATRRAEQRSAKRKETGKKRCRGPFSSARMPRAEVARQALDQPLQCGLAHGVDRAAGKGHPVRVAAADVDDARNYLENHENTNERKHERGQGESQGSESWRQDSRLQFLGFVVSSFRDALARLLRPLVPCLTSFVTSATI
jgi:hypothetical protein